MTAPVFRLAGAGDAEAIGRLHAMSWQASYRGSLTDAYLDGPVVEERRRVWLDRFAAPDPSMIVVLAEDARSLVGFVCAFVDRDAVFGTLIDNLHVDPSRKAGGIGRTLMRCMADRLGDVAPDRPVHLFVKASNVAAQGFYARIGGAPAGHETHIGVDGSPSPTVRILWASPSALADGTSP